MSQPLPDDLVELLKTRAEIETGNRAIPITQHIDYMAALEIERLRDNVSRLLDFIAEIGRHQNPLG